MIFLFINFIDFAKILPYIAHSAAYDYYGPIAQVY